MDEEIVALFCLCDDFLKAQRHREDPQRQMSDAEVMTTALVAVRSFGGNLQKARALLDAPSYIPQMLSKSRLIRRLHALTSALETLFNTLAEAFKQSNPPEHDTTTNEPTGLYLLDSFPVPVCDNIRISRCHLYPCKDRPPSLRQAWLAELCQEAPPPGREASPVSYRGYLAGKQRFFYGLRVHLLTTAEGRPVECLLAPGSRADVSLLPSFRFDLPPGSRVITDGAYNHYEEEEFLAEGGIALCPARKKNSRRGVPGYVAYVQGLLRKRIETTISVLVQAFPKVIHAVTPRGFELKVFLFVLAHSISFIL